MKIKNNFPAVLFLATLIIGAFLFSLPHAHAQAWSGIIDPSRAIDWTAAGVPGGIPNRTTICATINGSTYGNGSTDATAGIQAALNSCASGDVVSLSAGTFLISGNLSVPSNVTLRGAGANQTILNAMGTSGNVINLGNPLLSPTVANSVSITAGATSGSNSLTVSSASGITVGSYLEITELNDASFVNSTGSEGPCTWCDDWNGTRSRGQIVEVTSVNGAVIGISPGLYSAYSHTPLATPFTASAKYAGVENLQVYANNTGYGNNFVMNECAYCWLSGVEGNYADGNHVSVNYSYRDQIQNSYFSNAYLHTSGSHDSDVDLDQKSSGVLVQNNILERLHLAIMLEWGTAGNVVAYNYVFGNYGAGSNTFDQGGMDTHGAHPQYNLFEGNTTNNFDFDSIWGSSSDNTLFRNWAKGTTKLCSVGTGTATPRAAVTCTNTWGVQYVAAMRIDFLGSSYNLVGNIFGSQDMANLNQYNTPGYPITQVNQIVAVCGPSPCGPGSRSYDAAAYVYDFGFGEANDDGSSGFDTITPYSTLFSHGNYSSVLGTSTWSGSITHVLPNSLYLSSKPAWFGNTSWPAIGPDVTGGLADAYGHANAIPAEVCYESVMGGTDGTGSPLTFNADGCYPTSTVSSGGGGSSIVSFMLSGFLKLFGFIKLL